MRMEGLEWEGFETQTVSLDTITILAVLGLQTPTDELSSF